MSSPVLVTRPAHVSFSDFFSGKIPQFNTITDFIGLPTFVPNSWIYLIIVDVNGLSLSVLKCVDDY
jgi:hypothetical protein